MHALELSYFPVIREEYLHPVGKGLISPVSGQDNCPSAPLDNLARIPAGRPIVKKSSTGCLKHRVPVDRLHCRPESPQSPPA